MNVVVLVTWGGPFGKRNYYNRQEVGLARALADLGHNVEVHKSVPRGTPAATEVLGENCLLRDVPSVYVGNQGWFNAGLLRRFRPDAILMFTDLQASSPTVAKWCVRNGIVFVPYVGSMRTNRTDRRTVERISRARNFRMLRRYPVLTQNLQVLEELKTEGVSDLRLMPFALDFAELPKPDLAMRAEARSIFDLTDGPVLGFVGQMRDFKRPLLLPEVLLKLRETAPWKLVMVGSGPLEEKMQAAIDSADLHDEVRWEKSLPNREMWKLYASCDVLVNLNLEEIVGICILESLYYGTPVVAVDGPGPSLLIREGRDGFLSAPDVDSICRKIHQAYGQLRGSIDGLESASRFTWAESASILNSLLLERVPAVRARKAP